MDENLNIGADEGAVVEETVSPEEVKKPEASEEASEEVAAEGAEEASVEVSEEVAE